MYLYSPLRPGDNPRVTYGVGSSLYTTFPSMFNYWAGEVTEYTLVSYEYSGKTPGLPPAEDFYSLYTEFDAIRSGQFTSTMLGSHTLNVTLADENESRFYFTMTVIVNLDTETVTTRDRKEDLHLTQEEIE